MLLSERVLCDLPLCDDSKTSQMQLMSGRVYFSQMAGWQITEWSSKCSQSDKLLICAVQSTKKQKGTSTLTRTHTHTCVRLFQRSSVSVFNPLNCFRYWIIPFLNCWSPGREAFSIRRMDAPWKTEAQSICDQAPNRALTTVTTECEVQ